MTLFYLSQYFLRQFTSKAIEVACMRQAVFTKEFCVLTIRLNKVFEKTEKKVKMPVTRIFFFKKCYKI